MRGRILVVDDEAPSRQLVADVLAEQGYDVETAGDGYKALGKLAEFAPELVLTDLMMPGMSGIELMKRIRAMPDAAEVILLTAFGEVESAVTAMRGGAADYLTKPISVPQLLIAIERVLAHVRLTAEARHLRAELAQRHGAHNLVGTSEPIRRVLAAIERIAPARATVLITGESGTGKELVAAALHQHSERAAGPFVKLHCASLAESLLESELFGHERGAFTGAVARRDGRFAMADRGTLFLDEIGEITPAIQVKLLRFLQFHEFERVGGSKPITVDVRVIAATHRDLLAMVHAGTFREDLYYRLNVVTIDTPPLRERKDDVALLAQYFLDRFAAENDKDIDSFTPEALAAMVGYDWPGNVRELENAVERAVVMSPGPMIDVEHLPATVSGQSGDTIAIPGSSLQEIERYAIIRTLEATAGSTSRAAAILGISPRTIQYKLHEYNPSQRSDVQALRDVPDGAQPSSGRHRRRRRSSSPARYR
ncbi:MAG: sigma-54-dependent Fis family transcriptional regulator [Kofleriaceae bacterium]|nr:sigma-54-dependent Fis family transcriptional regulator [Myxococcales bacterium]MCB9558804.1 sigma-54-dependent Fis family transcriptional regulator [Kofleriaceae bacterium]MCB9570642.1 sigma-54-dependent Fis family transcriptional regulator [Kofleriaceae bacterium]